jgi:hypothetical protein
MEIVLAKLVVRSKLDIKKDYKFKSKSIKSGYSHHILNTGHLFGSSEQCYATGVPQHTGMPPQGLRCAPNLYNKLHIRML